MSDGKVLVAGGGGFIGGHLVARLLADGRRVRSVDVEPIENWHQVHPDAERMVLDLSDIDQCRKAVDGIDEVFNLAADMGGMGYIERFKANCMLSVLINTHLLMAARDAGVARYFYASSACVYAADKQTTTDAEAGLREEDAYPAMPEDGYGWEKMFSERMCRHFREDFGLATRVGRYHNIYGTHTTWDGGREKAPAALTRKAIQAKRSNDRRIGIWGDGQQRRSFTHVDDCVEGTLKLMYSDCPEPLNIGSDEMVSIDELVSILEDIAGVELQREYQPDAPKGVRGRNSNNDRVKAELGWAPQVDLRSGMTEMYQWIESQIAQGIPSKQRASSA